MDGLKCFEPQNEDDIISVCHSSTVIVLALKDTTENFNHFGLSVDVQQLFTSVDVSVFVKMKRIENRVVINYLRVIFNTLA